MIQLCEPDITEREIRYVTKAINKGEVSASAPPVRRFEKAFAKAFRVAHAVAVNSGGSALFLTVKALGAGPGDEIIVPDFTMVATALAVDHCDATPVFVDTKSGDVNIDPTRIEEKVTSRTRGIMVAHLYGRPCDMDAVLSIAKKHNLFVVEDATEAHGAKYKGTLVGTLGTAGCFSFYASKIMTTGEGGMVVTGDAGLAETIRHLREYDLDSTRLYRHTTRAWNLRMSALEAAIGLAQLERLDELIEKRSRIATYYEDNLKEVPGITSFPDLPNMSTVTWLYSVIAERRDALIAFLTTHGIEAKTLFVPLHLQPIYNVTGDFKNAEHVGAHGISLPSAPNLRREDQSYVIEKIKTFYLGRK